MEIKNLAAAITGFGPTSFEGIVNLNVTLLTLFLHSYIFEYIFNRLFYTPPKKKTASLLFGLDYSLEISVYMLLWYWPCGRKNLTTRKKLQRRLLWKS